jgi:hypothetical protein
MLPSDMRKAIFAFWVFLLVLQPAAATHDEDVASDAVATAFMQTRTARHLPKLERMGRNKFREKVCKKDTRFAAGLINDTAYETSNPAELPDAAQKLAVQRYAVTVPARFGVGVCLSNNSRTPTYSVLIATYESRWNSFWRTFD